MVTTPWWRVFGGFLSPLGELAADERAAFDSERAVFNRGRALLYSVPMLVLHLACFVLYGWFSGAQGAAHPAWRSNLLLIHGCMALLVTLLLLWIIVARGVRIFGEVFVVLYLTYGTAVSINSQHVNRGIDVYFIVVVTLSFAFRIHAATWTATSTAALVGLLVGVGALQRDPMVRYSVGANAVPLFLATWVVARTQLASFARDFRQRRMIEAQRDALEKLNGRLDRQLRDKVVDRSRELARALSLVGRAQATMELTPGSTLTGRFVVGQVIGRGGMGVVYRATDRLLERAVAVKVIAGSGDIMSLQRFLREAEAMAYIAHPAIARTFHVDVSADGCLFQVEELIDGEALDSVQRRLGTLAPPHVARLGAVLADALAAAHAQGIIHRDVKPSNIMLISTSPGLKLLDFGVSKMRARPSMEDATRSGVIVGTPAFMAPEQATSFDDPNDVVDVYSLGLTLWLLLTGELSVRRTGLDATAGEHPLPHRLVRLIERSLSVVPADRPPASAMRDELSSISIALDAADLVALNAAILKPSWLTAETQAG